MDHLTKDFQLNFFDIRWSQILDIFHIIFLVLNIMNRIIYWVFTLWSSEQTTHCGTSTCTATKAIQSYMIEKKSAGDWGWFGSIFALPPTPIQTCQNNTSHNLGIVVYVICQYMSVVMHLIWRERNRRFRN